MTGGPAAGGIVVIGVGNEFRRDDGLGPEVLSRLRDQVTADTGGGPGGGPGGGTGGVRLLACDGEPTRMIEAWAGASLALVVDAVVAGPPAPGRRHRITLEEADLAAARPVSSHGFGLGESVRLGRALDRMPARLIIHAVEVADTGFGVGLTPAVAAAAAEVTAAVLRDLAAVRPSAVRPSALRPAGARASGAPDATPPRTPGPRR